MAWTREQVNAAARAYRARNAEKVRERDRARDQLPHRKEAHRRWQRLHGSGGGRQRGNQRLYNAFVVTLEEAKADHDAWLESVDLWRMAEAAERLEHLAR